MLYIVKYTHYIKFYYFTLNQNWVINDFFFLLKLNMCDEKIWNWKREKTDLLFPFPEIAFVIQNLMHLLKKAEERERNKITGCDYPPII